MPAPQKLPSGSVLDLLVLSIAKLIDVSVRQLSKAKGPSCAPGGPWSQINGGLCVVANAHSAERTALGENSSAEFCESGGLSHCFPLLKVMSECVCATIKLKQTMQPC